VSCKHQIIVALFIPISLVVKKSLCRRG